MTFQYNTRAQIIGIQDYKLIGSLSKNEFAFYLHLISKSLCSNDKKILQSDWTIDTSSHTQPKVVSQAAFPWRLTPYKKN